MFDKVTISSVNDLSKSFSIRARYFQLLLKWNNTKQKFSRSRKIQWIRHCPSLYDDSTDVSICYKLVNSQFANFCGIILYTTEVYTTTRYILLR